MTLTFKPSPASSQEGKLEILQQKHSNAASLARSKSLCVGVSFGDIVALDSFDTNDSRTEDDEDTSNGSLSAYSAVAPHFSSSSKNKVASAAHPPPRRSHTMPASMTKLAPAPALQRVVQPELGGEACLLPPEEEERMIRILWDRLSEQERLGLSDPSMLTRHLRAEKGHVDKALHKCQAALRWRDAFGVASMHEWRDMLSVENATGKIYVRGYDAQGRAYMYMRPAFQNTNNEHDNMRHLVWNLEKAIACTRRKSLELGAKRPLEKINLVIDYQSFSLRNAPTMSASKYTLDILQKYYPERMYRAYCVNAPRVFQTFFTLIKAFIDPATKEKIVFVTTDDCHKLVCATERVDKLEAVVGGPATAREFDSKDYLSLPFDWSFDEHDTEI